MSDLQIEFQNIILQIGDVLERSDLTEDQRQALENAKLELEVEEEKL